MATPRDFRFSIDVSFSAGDAWEADEKLQDIVDDLDLGGIDVEVSPYSTNPQSDECECCGDSVWDDEMESCNQCGASICGDCMVNYDGLCVSCSSDVDEEDEF